LQLLLIGIQRDVKLSRTGRKLVGKV